MLNEETGVLLQLKEFQYLNKGHEAVLGGLRCSELFRSAGLKEVFLSAFA